MLYKTTPYSAKLFSWRKCSPNQDYIHKNIITTSIATRNLKKLEVEKLDTCLCAKGTTCRVHEELVQKKSNLDKKTLYISPCLHETHLPEVN